MSAGAHSLRPSRTVVTNVRWLMVVLAFLATTINYVDRANLGVAAPFIQKELGLSGTQTGWMLGAFFWSYARFQLPAGWGARSRRGHFGLVGMRERARRLGPLTIESRPGAGTSVEIIVPATRTQPELPDA